MLRNYYHKTDSKKYLQAITREIIPHNNYKLLSENLFQTMVTNYCKKNHSKHNAYKLFSEKQLQTKLINYYTGNHSKQCLQNVMRNHSQQYLQTIIRQLIPNNVYIQPFVIEIIPNKTYKLLSQNSLQTLLTNHYQRITFKCYVHG